MIKQELKYYVLWYIYSIWNNEVLPQQKKESIIVPIYKNGNKTDCNIYRWISLLSTAYKILSSIILTSLTQSMKLLGVISVRSIIKIYYRSNFYIRKILQKKWEYNGTVDQLFIYFTRAYDSVRRKVLHKILLEFGIVLKIARLIRTCLNEP
jgi:hypothetical protein